MHGFIEYIKETRAEMKNVTWPTKREVVSYTAIVIGLAILSALVLSIFDIVFTYLLDTLILT